MAVSPARLRKRRRLLLTVGGVVVLGIAAALVLNAFRDSVVFFYSPSEVQARLDDPSLKLADRRFRLGGLVAEDSVVTLDDGVTTEFTVTDGAGEIRVRFTGMLPALFREGQGVVAEGRLEGANLFIAEDVLAKHDENYMPPEVAEALKKSGHWEGPEAAQ
ncbi:MAG: cytochrome c maturation protein CcmE [Alphaproteobacteria bacterium]|nr:MAG: cytochrome c maturation protein CcmE [Alphaproteobacteria bacterium]